MFKGSFFQSPNNNTQKQFVVIPITIFDFWIKVELILALRRHFLEAGRVKGVAGKYALGTSFHIFSIEELEFPDISCIVLDS
ncbi:hypothetical protein EV2_035342 [Malus domestica]